MKDLDKNEYKVRLEEIKQQIEQENYEQAAEIADQIDWKKVRNVNTLCMISEVYEAVGRYDDSKRILLRAYRRSPMSRTVLYRLVEVTIALKQFDEAIGYYTEYVQAAPHDTNRYILKYKIYRGRGSSVNEQIDILKEYLDQEYNEKYAYELARLYKEADRMQECIAACDDLVLWFHSGKYVIKALELKKRYAPLTPKQQEIYDGRFAMEDEEKELELGREKEMVGADDTTEADTIIEDTERAIAEEVARAAREAMENAAAAPAAVVPAAEAAAHAAEEIAASAGEAAEAAEETAAPAGEAAEAAPVEIPGTEDAGQAAEAIAAAAGEAAEAAEEIAASAGEAAEAAEEITRTAAGEAADAAPVELPGTEDAGQAVEEITRTAAGEAARDAGEMTVPQAVGQAVSQIIGETLPSGEAKTLKMPTADDIAKAFADTGDVLPEGSGKASEPEMKEAVEGALEGAVEAAGETKEAVEGALEGAVEAAGETKEAVEGALEGAVEAAGDTVEAGTGTVESAAGAAETDVEAGEPQTGENTETPPAPVREKTPEELQTGIANDMRQIIGNVGRLEYVNENELVLNDIIEESKREQDKERTKLRIPSLRMPDLQRKQAAGKLTIDDILLSMGERGDEIRATAAKASPYAGAAPGVLSAVDEALLNMGISTASGAKDGEEANADVSAGEEKKEHVSSSMKEIVVPQTKEESESTSGTDTDAGDTEGHGKNLEMARALAETYVEEAPADVPAQEGKREDASSEDTEDVKTANVRRSSMTEDDLREVLDAANAGKPKPEEQEQEGSFRDKTMEEIIAARTRRIPTEEISRRYASRPFTQEELEGIYSGQNAGGSSEYDTAAAADDEQVNEGDAGQDQEPAGARDTAQDAGQDPEERDERDAAGNQEQSASPDGGEYNIQEGSGPEEAYPGQAQDNAGKAPAPENAPQIRRGPVLKDDLRELFDGFLGVRGLEGQIVNSIRQAMTKGNDRTSRTGNILIFGAHGSGKTTLAMALAKAIAQERGQEYVKMARIYSTDLNRKDIAATVAKIAGGFLIVEEAGDLDDSIADQLTTAMEFRTDGLIVILEDEQAYIHDLLLRHPRLTMKFTSEIYLPSYTAQELAGFAEAYADSRDFVFSETSREVLVNRISQMMEDQEPKQALSISAVKEITDRAIDKASGFGRKLFGGKKRYDSEGRIILKDKDIGA